MNREVEKRRGAESGVRSLGFVILSLVTKRTPKQYQRAVTHA